MSDQSELFKLMQEPLPTIGQQKRYGYRTNVDEAVYLHQLINREVFSNVLPTPEIEVKSRCRKYWGMCYGEVHNDDWNKPYCKIRLMDKWFSKQWLITILAHEMCHQYQWDVHGPERINNNRELIMSHGPTFFKFRDNLRIHGIPLKKEYSRRKWFKHQSFFKLNKRLNTLCEI